MQNLTTRRRTKPQSLWTSTKVSVEATAIGVSDTIKGVNDIVELAREAIAVAKAENRRSDSAEFAINKADDLGELYSRIAILEATGVKSGAKGKETIVLSELVQQQIATLQKSIAIISEIEIEYK